MHNVSTGTPNIEKTLISVNNSRDIFIQGNFPLAGNRSFIHLTGINEGVVLKNNYFGRIGIVVDEESENKENLIIE